MATKLIRDYVDETPNLELPENLKEMLQMKRLSKKVYKPFVEYFNSIGEMDLANELLREAKLVKKGIKQISPKPDEEDSIDGDAFEDAVEDAIGDGVQDAVADLIRSSEDSAQAANAPLLAKLSRRLNELYDLTKNFMIQMQEQVKATQEQIKATQETSKSQGAKLAHLGTVLEMMNKNEMVKTDSRTDSGLVVAGPVMSLAERFAMKSRRRF
jgi:hypothetical protein